MPKADFDKIVIGVEKGVARVRTAFEHIRPSLADRILETTAVIAYHRPPINEDDKDIEKLCGLLFEPADLTKLRNRIARFDVYAPKKPAVYMGIDARFDNPFEILRYGLNHLDEAPQKIMQHPKGTFYLTQKPLLSGGNWMFPEVDFYIFGVRAAVR